MAHTKSAARAAAPSSGSGSGTREAALPAQAAQPQEHGSAGEPQTREEMIAVAAYFLAEKRGFAPGCELDDWLRAEAEIDAQLPRQPAPTRQA